MLDGGGSKIVLYRRQIVAGGGVGKVGVPDAVAPHQWSLLNQLADSLNALFDLIGRGSGKRAFGKLLCRGRDNTKAEPFIDARRLAGAGRNRRRLRGSGRT